MSEQKDIIVINTESWKDESKPIVQEKIEIFDLVFEDHPALRTKLPEFDFKNPPVNPNAFASSLVETCKKHNGIGLSANQCGFYHRVFVAGSGDNFVAFFNPKLISISEQKVKLEEGCLSFKDLFLQVERPAEIVVEYQDFTGASKTAKYTGLTARCFLHELDHMNGITYHEHVKPVALKMAQKKRTKISIKRKLVEKMIDKKVKNGNRSRNI